MFYILNVFLLQTITQFKHHRFFIFVYEAYVILS